MTKEEPKIQDVLEAVHDLATHVDQGFADVRDESRHEFKQELKLVREDIVNEIDRFVSLHRMLDVEIISLRSRCDRLERQ